MKVIHLISDTVTMPTESMLDAMRNAKVGDDVYHEDPTVKKLEALAAEKVGKEAALFVPSGTMGNLISLLSQTTPGDEVILGASSHIYNFEVGGLSRIAGLVPRPIDGKHGAMLVDDIQQAIRTPNIHNARTSLICVESSHNRAGGTVLSEAQLAAIGQVAKENGLVVHLDGARIFNAAIALGVDARQLTRYSDSVMFCLSKGLSAPVGSIVAGTEEFISKARKARKMLGGGMRQVGVIAAAGIVALTDMIDRLREDHEVAQYLARGLIQIEGISVDIETVQTNIVIYDVKNVGISSKGFIGRLRKYNITAGQVSPTGVRMVTHRHISYEDVDHVLSSIREIVDRASW